MWEKMETKTIVYDLDTSGGLMEVRVALLIPFPQRREGTSALRPTKPVLSSQRKRAGGGGFFLTQILPPFFAIRGAELSLRGRLQQFHLPAALDSLSRGTNPLHVVAPAGLPTPFSSAPLCFPQHVRVPGFRPLQSLALESPTVHTRKWREGNRAPSPHPPTLILPIWKRLFSLCCRNAVRVGSPRFRGAERFWEQLGWEEEGQKGGEGWVTEKPCRGGDGPPGSSECAHTPFMCVCSKSKLCWLPPRRTRQKSGVGSLKKSPGEAAGPPTTTAAIAAKKVGISCAVTTARPPSTSSAGKVWGPLWSSFADPSRHIPSPGLPLAAEITGACSR